MPTPKKSPTPNHDRELRQHLLELLTGGQAHATFDDIIKSLPPNVRGAKPANFPHSPWMLLEHLRIAQSDILDFSTNPKYKHRKWPDSYWPNSPAPPNAAAWNKSLRDFRADLKAIKALSRQSPYRFVCTNPLGHRPNHPPRSLAGSRSQRLPPGAVARRPPPAGRLGKIDLSAERRCVGLQLESVLKVPW